jgi:hypothetical protein
MTSGTQAANIMKVIALVKELMHVYNKAILLGIFIFNNSNVSLLIN